MKIAYLASQYPAVSHTFIRREIAALRQLGVDIVTCSIRPGDGQSEADQLERANTFCVLGSSYWSLAWSVCTSFVRRPRRWIVVLFATLRHRLPGVVALLKSFAYFAEAMRLAEELRRVGATHIHNHFANPASHVGLAASRYLGVGWSVTVHGSSDFAGPTTPLLSQKVVYARFIASVSHYGRAQVMRVSAPSEWHKVHLVRCGVQLDRVPQPSRTSPGPGDCVEFLSVGRLSPEKGQLGLIQAFAIAANKGLNGRLRVIGSGSEQDSLMAAVSALGLKDRVEFLGSRSEPEVLNAMARAHVFVLSSFLEGLPVVLMEALATGLPVIAPVVAGIPELVAHRETGLLFAAGNWDELAEQLLLMATDPELRARLAAAGRARVLEHFDVSKSVVPLVELFRIAHSRSAEAQPH